MSLFFFVPCFLYTSQRVLFFVFVLFFVSYFFMLSLITFSFVPYFLLSFINVLNLSSFLPFRFSLTILSYRTFSVLYVYIVLLFFLPLCTSYIFFLCSIYNILTRSNHSLAPSPFLRFVCFNNRFFSFISFCSCSLYHSILYFLPLYFTLFFYFNFATAIINSPIINIKIINGNTYAETSNAISVVVAVKIYAVCVSLLKLLVLISLSNVPSVAIPKFNAIKNATNKNTPAKSIPVKLLFRAILCFFLIYFLCSSFVVQLKSLIVIIFIIKKIKREKKV